MKCILHLADIRQEYEVADETAPTEIVSFGLKQILDTNEDLWLPLVGELYFETDEDNNESVLFSVPLYLANIGEYELAKELLKAAEKIDKESPAWTVWQIVKNAKIKL